MKYAADFRYEARGALAQRWGLAIGTGFIAGLLGGGVGSYSNPNIEWDRTFNWNMEQNRYLLPFLIGIVSVLSIFILVTLFLGGPITLGYCRFNKNLINNTNPQFKDLFSNFTIFWKAFVMQFLMGLFTFLWSLLFIIPGIIAAYKYSMTPYILDDNPDLPVMEAINQSKEMMDGSKIRLFCLEISFIGWAILCVFTCGIGYLWLMPYTAAARAAFYIEIKGKAVRREQEDPVWFTK